MNISENKKTLLAKIIFLTAVFSVLMISCNDPVPEPEPEKEKAPALTIAINGFIKTVMTDVYLWYKEVPDIDINYEFDSKAYFDKLLYTDDKWSFITDDAKKLEDSFEGKETSYGWSLTFGMFSDTKTIFALVEYVYPGTPAEKAGFKRGDLIYKMNNADITVACERPKLAKHNLEMRQSIADVLDVDVTQISIKATTTEKLGFTGRQEGILATATVLICHAK